MRNVIKLWITVLSVVVMASVSHAAIMTTGTNAGATVSSGNSTTISNVDLNGGNAIAVIVTSENYGEFSATYDGEDLLAFEGSEGIQSAAVLYLINPMASIGDLVINGVDGGDGGGGATDFAYSFLTLSNVGGVATDSPSTNSSTVTGNSATIDLPAYTTTVDGGFVYVGVINNDFRTGAGRAPNFVSGNASTGFGEIQTGNNNAQHFYGSVASAGTYVETFQDLEQRNVVTGIAFEDIAANEIPEPASFALLGLSGLVLLRRSRHAA